MTQGMNTSQIDMILVGLMMIFGTCDWLAQCPLLSGGVGDHLFCLARFGPICRWQEQGQYVKLAKAKKSPLEG